VHVRRGRCNVDALADPDRGKRIYSAAQTIDLKKRLTWQDPPLFPSSSTKTDRKMKLFNFLVHLYDVLYRLYMKVIGKIRPSTQATTVFGAQFSCVRSDYIQRRIAFFGLFEPNLTYFITSVLKPGHVFIDVGANIGYFTLLASKWVGASGKVYAIEASPSTYDLLVANLKLNEVKNVQAINMAVADTDCHVRVKSNDNRNIGANSVQIIASAEVDSVVGRPLHDIVAPDLGRASFIKIDVEGTENLILPSIFEYFAQLDSDTIIVSEIAEKNAHLVEFAKAKGYSVRALRNNYAISHLLIRSFLSLTNEHDFFVIRNVNSYVSNQYDYVFSRRGNLLADSQGVNG
jgi:FkbM family methyltransferase